MSDCYYGAEACRHGHTVDCPARGASKPVAKERHSHEWKEHRAGSWECVLCHLIVPHEAFMFEDCQREAKP